MFMSLGKASKLFFIINKVETEFMTCYEQLGIIDIKLLNYYNDSSTNNICS